ncbi:hypothetical protein L1987_47843 [Smallanthus sonchifolius]|uniref:Uncharacterized protein n=1 Tax=Smallanthus sonchifolius TaxID=185202 RepID=A0ACB9FPM2_9ASTR|nr:hypothetical protein L1987_47843 [Smallanthus sonchifolius]
MPVFYDVNPTDVRKQKGDFGVAFAKQEAENINKAQLWRNALVDTSDIAGWEPKHIAGGLCPSDIDVDENLVGMKTRLHDLKLLLEIGNERVRMVGIWGAGGSGKTTLATYAYMDICHHFQGHCIMENVREESSKINLKKIQENMLSALFKREVKVDRGEQPWRTSLGDHKKRTTGIVSVALENKPRRSQEESTDPTTTLQFRNPPPVVEPENPTLVVQPENPLPIVQHENPAPVVQHENPPPVFQPENPPRVVEQEIPLDVQAENVDDDSDLEWYYHRSYNYPHEESEYDSEDSFY